jgi:DNA repair protein RecO (recombination protein O)
MSLLPQPLGTGAALVLRVWPTGETSVVVSLLTQEHGALRAVAKGARQARSALQPLVQPGRLIDVEVTLTPGRELQFLRGGELRLDPLAEGATLERSAYLLAALEIVDRCRPGDDRDADLFHLCEEFVRVLSSALAGGESAIYCAFELALLDLQGIRPQLAACVQCERPLAGILADGTWLDPAAGGLVCGVCRLRTAAAAARPLTSESLAAWVEIAGAPGHWPHRAWSRPVAREWGILLHRFLEYHLPGYRLPAALDLLRPLGLPEPPTVTTEEGGN